MKKSIIMFLALSITFVPNVNTTAQASGNSKTVESKAVVAPLYSHITLMGASLSIGSLGKAVSGGFVIYVENYNSTLTIELQRSSGSGWSSVKSWSKSFTGKGNHSFEEEYYVMSGYTYRVVTNVAIKNGNTVLETASSTSSEVTY